MTWWEIYQRGIAELGEIVPDRHRTPQLHLAWLSEAQHLYQSQTNVVKCQQSIVLNPDSTTGLYTLPKCLKLLQQAQVFLNSSSPAIKVEILPWDLFDQKVADLQALAIPTDRWAGLYYVSIHLNKVRLYPFNGATGTLKLDYIPHLIPYSPTDDTDWAGWGVDPTSQMKQQTPEREMLPALDGMRAYAKKMCIEQMPNGMNLFGAQWQTASAAFERGTSLIQYNSTSYQKQHRVKTHMSIVR